MDDYLAARTDPSPALFLSFHRPTAAARPTENRLTSAGARHICLEVARRLGLPRFSPHVLRHTLGTLLQEEMGDARLTAEVLGHSVLGSVAGYTKVAATHLREGYRRIQQRGL
jgi:integrase/recombinase XerD